MEDEKTRADLSVLADMAEEKGMDGAAGLVRALAEAVGTGRYMCHADREKGEQPLPDCVLDYGCPEDCSLASGLSAREQCPYWRPWPGSGLAAMVRTAVADAVDSPAGTVPESARPFYDPGSKS